MKPVLTAHVGTNADLFSAALKLYTKPGNGILDMTYGKGVFWRNIDISCYGLVKNDLDPERGDIHEDFRKMSFGDSSFDVVVLDPPYASRSSNKRSFVGSLYNNGKHRLDTVDSVLEFYREGIAEAWRLVKDRGIVFVKCMDEVSGGKQARNHISIWRDALEMGFVDEDLFVLVQDKTPVMRHNHQLHARKNNSFLWVFRK